ncbi:serine hydrolase-domain-containing protein [Clohesyomyces aquaticus]|uniref:Serine hydrolase-domain-containing protein n=1 Tax=Clohesyomyces aquaticus TaxID=1231657 RepID=A0A1Y1YAJ2_9PLEO|nr:serine hydrolase-domain-containing protein [Clohesyomyces aquaticus]
MLLHCFCYSTRSLFRSQDAVSLPAWKGHQQPYNADANKHELGDSHTFEYVEGEIECSAAPGLGPFSSPDEGFFRYYDPDKFETCEKALLDLGVFIRERGPFDAVMTFSEGAALAATFIIEAQRSGQEAPDTCGAFKCAIFFCGGVPYDVPLGRVMGVRGNEGIIQIPTAHIWGSNDEEYPSFGIVLSTLCKEQLREIYIHPGGHEIPGPGSLDAVTQAVNVIRNTIERASLLF